MNAGLLFSGSLLPFFTDCVDGFIVKSPKENIFGFIFGLILAQKVFGSFAHGFGFVMEQRLNFFHIKFIQE